MSKKVKTLDELKKQMKAIRAEIEARRESEAKAIGAYVQETFGVDELADFRANFEVKRIGGEV